MFSGDSSTPAATDLQGALPCKTPVSLLQELCMRRGISPKYDLLQIEGAVHEPTFVYRVTVGEFAASGSGQSKKKAKHSAAKAVLDVIIHGPGPAGQNNGSSDVIAQAQQTQDLSNVVSPYDDGIPGNPVGQLQEMCMTRRWPPPTYELTSEEGFPHERTFGIACTIATHKEIGYGKSKKLAKRQAANAMLIRFSDLPPESQGDVLHDDDEDIATKLAARYSGIKDYKINSITQGDNRKVSQFHNSLRKKAGPQVKGLQTVALNAAGINFVQMLKDIAFEASFETSYFDIEEISVTGERQCLLQLATMPVAVIYGVGPDKDSAQSAAALNALEYLKLMTKPKQPKNQDH